MRRPSRPRFAPAVLALPVLTLALPSASLRAQRTAGADSVDVRQWDVPWGGVPRDPYVAPDGERVWFVGQRGNYVAFFTPRDQQFKRIEVDSGTHPHTVVTDRQGNAWYTGNRNGMIGRIDAKTFAITRYPMPDAESTRDPHTIAFDANGDLWFTVQNSNKVGHLNHRTGAVELIEMSTPRSRPYGILVAPDGQVWFDLFGTNAIGRIDPKTKELTTYPLPDERSRPRRIARTSDGMIWYTDYTRGKLGRLDPTTKQVSEYDLPGGAGALPYAMAADDQDRLWVFETGSQPNRLVGFDPATGRFLEGAPVGNPTGPNTVRHVHYDAKTKSIWFGDDQGHLGRAVVPVRRSVM